MITQQDIEAQLRRIKDNKKRKGYMTPQDYQKFMPATLGIESPDETLHYARLDQIKEQGTDATRLAQTIREGRDARRMLIKKRQEMRRAKNALNQARNSQPQYTGGSTKYSGNVNFYGNYQGERDFAPRWGKDNTPEVSDIKNLNPWAGKHGRIVGVNWRGMNFAANEKVADIFVALLDDLYAAGYRPVSIGGYNDRNIAGTNTKSLHSYGYAIDIDPAKNPVQYGSNNHALPPNVAALAAKYGLSWGGNWNSYKDPMHFSVAYGGRE